MKTEKAPEVEAAIELLTKTFSTNDKEITPRYPYVLVRKIPREMLSKHNILLLSLQGKGPGKPIGEGVVIRTWEPHEGIEKQKLVFDEEVRERLKNFHHSSAGCNTRYSDNDIDELLVLLGRVRMRRLVQRQSDLSPGDIVLFPQYAGFPADGDADAEDNLWFIPDIPNADITKVGIIGHFKFVDELTYEKLLDRMLMTSKKFEIDGGSVEEALKLIKEHYDLIPKKIVARTRLG